MLLKKASLFKVPHSIEEVGTEVTYKVVPVGQPLENAPIYRVNITGEGLKPWSPCQVRCKRFKNGDAEISWTRRARIHGGWRDRVDTPMIEPYARYDLVILKNGQPIRTLEGLEQSQFTYSNIQQIEDFGATQQRLELVVYQVSESVGRGAGEHVVI